MTREPEVKELVNTRLASDTANAWKDEMDLSSSFGSFTTRILSFK